MNNDKTVSPDIERLAPGLTREWLCDRRIIVFNFKDVSRETVDACARGIRETIERWPLDLPYLCAYDLQFPQAALTAYLRERLKEVMEMYRDRGGSTAIVIQRTFMANLAQFFLNTQKQGTRYGGFSSRVTRGWTGSKMCCARIPAADSKSPERCLCSGLR